MLKLNTSEKSNEIPCLLLPNQGFRLILPNTAIAEIVTWCPPQHSTSSDWLLGFFEWREQRLPLLTIHIEDQTPSEQRPLTKIAVLNAVSEDLGFRYYGIALCGIPKLMRIGRDEISVSSTENDPPTAPSALSLVTPGTKVTLHGEEAWIPDLDEVEHQISQLFR
ncbi:MAG: chemotaxis protein CheW [Pseudomonadales bacterium]|nr:chemotaxis protein CheW [Pseudomonadales bacterium]